MTILRALSAAVKLPERLPQVSGRTSMLSAMSGLLGSSSAQGGMAAYREIGAAYGPVHRLAQSVALTDWSLYAQTKTAGTVARQLLDDATPPARHPGTALWTLPNPFMPRYFFLLLTELMKITSGGVYWVMCPRDTTGSPYPPRDVEADIELWPILASRITPVPDPDRYLAGYIYSLGIEKIPLPVGAVIPIGAPDPGEPLAFAGPLQAIMTDLEAERYASQYNRNTFLNDARPGGVIEFDTPLPRDRFEELVLRWREQHQGLNNAKRVAIIEGGKWVDSKITNAEMEYEKLRKMSREEVMFALGMPFAVMLTENVNLANAQMADKQYGRHTLRPELEDIKGALNLRVLPLLGDNLTMDFVLPAPEDEAFDVFAGTSGWLSGIQKRNEARAAVGLPADPDWDGYITDLPGTEPKPLAMPPARYPRGPTRLSYQAKQHPVAAQHEGSLERAWAGRLDAVRRSYQDLLNQRNGTH